jgi:thiol-disulfide isomerase/thioredoxin
MKWKLFFLACFVCPILTFAGVKFDDIEWKAAKKKAKAENKLIFLDFYTTWCGPCKMMDAMVLSTDAVGKYFNAHFVNIKVDADRETSLASQFSIRSYPSYVFADSNGDIVDMFTGGRSLEVFLKKAELLQDKALHLNFLTKQYKEGNRGNDFMVAYFTRLKECNRPIDKQLKEYWKIQTDSLLLEPHNWKLIQAFAIDVEDEKFKYFTEHQPAYISRYGKEPVYKFIENAYVMTLLSANRSQKPAKVSRVKKQLLSSGYSFTERVLSTYQSIINR